MKLIDCRSFKGMIQSAANHLENKQDEIDKLNVFPVPDGDTGTNMKMTFVAGVNETVNYLNDFIGDTAKHFSRNMLMELEETLELFYLRFLKDLPVP